MDSTEGVTFAHPHTAAIDYTSPSPTMEKACAFFVGLNYPDGVKSINITGAVIQFQKKIAEQKSPLTEVLVETLVRKNLPAWVYEDGIVPTPAPQKRKKPAAPKPAGAPGGPGGNGNGVAPGNGIGNGAQPLDGTEEPPTKRLKSEAGGTGKTPTTTPPATPPPQTNNKSPRAPPVAGVPPGDGEPPLKKAKTETPTTTPSVSPSARAKPAPIRRAPTPAPILEPNTDETMTTITID